MAGNNSTKKQVGRKTNLLELNFYLRKNLICGGEQIVTAINLRHCFSRNQSQ